MLKRSLFIPAISTIVLVFWTLPALAEAIVDTVWVRRYNGPGNDDDNARAIAVDGSGNVYVTGVSFTDYATIKYKPNGDTAWVRRYNGPGNSEDKAHAIAVDGSGNVYVTGESQGSGTHDDYATIKYDPNGDTAWVRRYNGTENSDDWAHAIAIDGSGNVYVTGTSYGDYATIKYLPNGDTAWVRGYIQESFAIAVDGSGNAYVTGASYPDYATVKYLPNGDTAWVKRYKGLGNDDDCARAIAVDGSGYVYVTGWSYGGGTGEDYATIKYKPNGDTAWVRRYNGPASLTDLAHAIAVDRSGNVYVTGESYHSGTYEDYLTIKYYPTGDTAWVRRYNGPGNDLDCAFDIAVDDSCNAYVTGESHGNGTSVDYTTIKYYSNGDTAWVRRYNGTGNAPDWALAIAVDDSTNVYVTGGSAQSNVQPFNFDIATIKYVKTSTDVKDEREDQEKPSEFALSQNYPNPFNLTTKIEFTLAKSGFINLDIYDILGRKVRTLVSEQLSSGYKSLLWDGKNESGKDVASGIYFYKLKAQDFSETRKLLLLK